MRFILTRALLVLVCLGLFSLSPALAGAKSGPQEPMGNLVVILHTDDPASADAAIRIATVAAARGHKVTMLLRVKGIQLALKDTNYKLNGVALQDKLSAFMKAGYRVFVGGGCMNLSNISPKRLIPGVRVGVPDSVMGMIFEKNTRIISQ